MKYKSPLNVKWGLLVSNVAQFNLFFGVASMPYFYTQSFFTAFSNGGRWVGSRIHSAPHPTLTTLIRSGLPQALLTSHKLLSTAWLWIYKNLTPLYCRYILTEVSNLLRALKQDELVVHYQPIVNMRTGLWLGAEALLRWPTKGQQFSPETTMALFERAGLMPHITRWVCQQVIEEYSQFLWACEELYVTINLSAADVMDPTFPAFINQLLTQYKVAPSKIAFEVTERVALEERAASMQLKHLRAQGHLIILDDFGTCYSSLSYLDNLPVDIIKIDKSFAMKKDGSTANIIIAHILHMAKKLAIHVVVEGVETQRQADRLSALGAQVAQGWLYSKELTAPALVRGYFSVPHPKINQVI